MWPQLDCEVVRLNQLLKTRTDELFGFHVCWSILELRSGLIPNLEFKKVHPLASQYMKELVAS